MAGNQQDEFMLLDSLTADASTAPPAPSESSEAEERASKRRRLSPDSPVAHVENEEELCIIEPIPIAAAAGLHTSDVSRAAVEQSSIDCDETKQSSETDSGAVNLDQVSPDSAASSPTATGSAGKPASKRRAQACRVAGCGLVLSSASNRLRHERSKHKLTTSLSGSPPQQQQQQQQQQRHSSPAAFIDARPRRSYLHGAAAASRGAATSPSSPGPQTYRSSSKRSSAAMINTRSPPMIPLARLQSLSEAEAEAEEEDWELAHFLATGSAGHDLSAGEEQRPLSASTSSGDDTKSDEGSSHDPQLSSSTPSSESDSNDSMGMNFPGNPLLYSDEEMQAGCQSFLVWLSEPPLTPCEFLVKGRSRLKSLAQLTPIKNALRFIYQRLAENEETRPATVDLHVWTSLATCQALYSALCERGVGSGRFHGIFLLIKKVLVYISGCNSIAQRQYLPPNLIESYGYVSGICSENGLRRKTEARNRTLFGVKATKQLLLDHRGAHSSQPFAIPATWTTDKEVQEHPAPPSASSLSAAATAPAVGTSNNEMSTKELQQVTKQCLAGLHELMEVPLSSDPTKAGVSDRWFMCLLITATLALGLAPRSMVLSQLRIGSSFTKGEDGRLWIKLLAEQSKNNRPTCFALPLQLTPVYTHYIEQVRPRLLAQAIAGSKNAVVRGGDAADPQHLFMKRNSASARTDFNSCVNMVTQKFLHRPLNTHSFRSAVVTAFYDNTCSGSESELIVLSQIMGHDIGTARSYYYKPKFSSAAVQANEKMTRFLLQSDA